MPQKSKLKWASLTAEALNDILIAFEKSSLNLAAFCVANGVSVSGFTKYVRSAYPERVAAALKARKRKTTPYVRGRAFEYRVIAALNKEGFTTCRSPASRGAFDMMAVRPGEILFVQAKSGGSIPPAERLRLITLAVSVKAVPVLAEKSDGRTLRFWRIEEGPERFPYSISAKDGLLPGMGAPQ
jgi:Holliday junction resolvase